MASPTQAPTIAPRPSGRIPLLKMETRLFEGFKDDEVTDEMLEDATKLFSENYGVWSEHAAQHMGKFAKAGIMSALYRS